MAKMATRKKTKALESGRTAGGFWWPADAKGQVMTKAKAKKRRVILPIWIVRDDDGEYHATVSHIEPGKDRFGIWWENPMTRTGYGQEWDTEDYEASTLKKYHLAPGGGPLKMRLVGA